MDYVEITSFNAGMNAKVNPMLNRLEEARVAKNADLSEIGTLKKDPGWTKYLDSPDSNNILALVAYYIQGTSITRWLLRDSNTNIYKQPSTGTSWQSISATGISHSNTPAWVVYNNIAMRFNGQDGPFQWNGTTWSALGGSPPNGNIACVFKDRVYVAGVTSQLSTVYFSNVGDPQTWTSYNNFNVNINDGDQIRAMAPIYDSLIIFKEFSMWQYQVDSKNNPSTLRYISLDIGTTAWQSIVNIGGIPYFFNRKGIYQFAGQYPELISLKMQPFIDAVSNPYAVVGFQDVNKYCLYIGTVTVDSKTYTNCVLIYDTLQDQWTVKTPPAPIVSATNFINTSNMLNVFVGDNAGNVYQWKSGYSWNSTPIELEYETGIIEPPNPNQDKLFRQIEVRSKDIPESPATIHYNIDGQGWRELGQVRKTREKLKIPDTADKSIRRGSDIKLRIHETSTVAMRDIYKIRIGYDTVGGEQQKSQTK